MNIRSIALAVASISLMACTHHDPTTAIPGIRSRDFGTLNGAKLELFAEGGIAALQTKYTVDHDTRVYGYSMRHICSDKCGAPMDTASGTLSPAAADSLFNLVWAESPSARVVMEGTIDRRFPVPPPGTRTRRPGRSRRG